MELGKFKELYARFYGKDLPQEVVDSEEFEAYMDAWHEDEACYNWATAEKLKAAGFDYESYCCMMMADKIHEGLDEEGEPRQDDPEVIINKWDEGIYGIPVHNGRGFMVMISYCPWCGTKLSN